MCPGVSHRIPNGVGFENSADIIISGLNFKHCGPITSGLFFNKTSDVLIVNSSFHHNTDNGIQIILGNNITIRDCNFFSNVGTQPDKLSDLITDDLSEFRGVGLGIFFEDQEGVKVTIEGCNFTDNIAYKSASYNPDDETRPFGFIPFGNGGGVYIQLNRVHNAYIKVSNCNFTNNKAINQGGALVMLPVNSNNTTLDVVQCRFIENRALGFSLSSQNDTVDISNVDDFVNNINTEFAFDLDTQSLRNLTFSGLRSTGGFGGAISVSLFGTVEFNKLCIRDSYFSRNTAYAAGAVGFVVRDLLSNVENGVDSNQVFIENCVFLNNFALYGSVFTVVSYARVDIASLPASIKDCTFLGNSNFRGSIPLSFSNRFGIIGTVLAIRFPLIFNGSNLFQSNIGGGLNVNHATITVQGRLGLYDHSNNSVGGAMRIGEVTLMHLLPDTTLIFGNNSASQFGGAIGVENIRSINEVSVNLNDFCFIQYNIGDKYERQPEKWKASFIFDHNYVTNERGQGDAFFAGDISACVLGKQVSENNIGQIFNLSIFSVPTAFDFSNNKDSVTHKPDLETAPHRLIVENATVFVSLGEIFSLIIYAEDQNGNIQDGVYSYYANLTASPSIVLRINLDTDDIVTTAFGVVRNVAAQTTTLVMHNAFKIQNNCRVNYKNSYSFPFGFSLNLTDSSNGMVVSATVVPIIIQCCHVGYEYDDITGVCVPLYNRDNDIILGPDKISNKYIYVRPDYYGGFNDEGYFVTARIPTSYHSCAFAQREGREGSLPGCLVMDDNIDEQCSQGRTGFLCGKCPHHNNQGTALSLNECVSCEAWHIVVFVFTCILIIMASMAVIRYNIGLPNALKGFVFFIQVVGYVYKTNDGEERQWHYYLSRFFGFSLYFPLCISQNLGTVHVAMLGFIPPLLMILCVLMFIFLARFSQRLSKTKTVDGIWFLVLIIYVYTADTCLNLLRCVQVFEPTEFKGRRVYYFDGTLECFNGHHLPCGVLAIIVSALVLIPFTLYVLAISFNLIRNAGPMRDIISFEIKYKYHWWSGFDLLRRLLFFLVYLIFENFASDYTQLAMTLTAVSILVMTARVQPYTQKWVNVVEGLILLDLALITAFFLDDDQLLHSTNNSFAIVLLVLPFVYFLIYIVIKIAVLFWRKIVNTSDKNYGSDSTSDLLLSCWMGLSQKQPVKPRTTPLLISMTEENVYTQYRDELDEFVTVKD